MQTLADLRQEYKKHQLSEDMVLSDPITQFNVWFQEALKGGVIEPNAFVLATVGDDNRPSARVLLLKGVENGGCVFYTNYGSQKSKELVANPQASMCFLWLELERQVRISGAVSKISREESDIYFHSRPRESQIGAWVSPQSQVIHSRQELESRLETFSHSFKDGEVPLPDNWGGYILYPDEIEFWQGRPNRLHDRILYSKSDDNSWKIQRLAP